jgi:Protein of unknown function (DUF1236)
MGAGLVALAAASPSLAQSTGAGGEGQAQLALPPEKQSLIREQAKRSDLPVAKLDEPVRIGMVVPQETELLVLPQDAGTEVPTTTTYKYLLSGDLIAVVEPESRKVIQLIKR